MNASIKLIHDLGVDLDAIYSLVRTKDGWDFHDQIIANKLLDLIERIDDYERDLGYEDSDFKPDLAIVKDDMFADTIARSLGMKNRDS